VAARTWPREGKGMILGITYSEAISFLLAASIIFWVVIKLLRGIRKGATKVGDPTPPGWGKIFGTSASMMAAWVKGLLMSYAGSPIKGRIFIHSIHALEYHDPHNRDALAETEDARFQRILGSRPLADSMQSADTVIKLFWASEYSGGYGEFGKYGTAAIATCNVTVTESSTGRVVRRKTFRGLGPPSKIYWNSGEFPPSAITTQLGKPPTKLVEEYLASFVRRCDSSKL